MGNPVVWNVWNVLWNIDPIFDIWIALKCVSVLCNNILVLQLNEGYLKIVAVKYILLTPPFYKEMNE